jgi:anti-sigma regulatory factor (Ser/Thr protein kinase)
MVEQTALIEREFTATLPSIPQARRWAGEYAVDHGASARVAEDVRLAVSEAVSNVVRHAYLDRDPGVFLVIVGIDRGRLVVSVRDFGIGPHAVPRQPGMGLGRPLMRAVCGTVEVRQAMPGTLVEMRFHLDAP